MLLLLLLILNCYGLSSSDVLNLEIYHGTKMFESGSDSFNNIPVYLLNNSKVVGKTDSKYVSFSIDTNCIRKGINRTLLRNERLISLLSYLAPGYLRIGGTESDRLIFHEINSIISHVKPVNNTFIMSGEEWLALNNFAKQTGFKVIFDINVLLRKNFLWDTTNVKQLLDFSTYHNLDIDWQLGNEPNAFRNTFNVSLSPSQLAEDFQRLRSLLSNYTLYKNSLLVGPDVTSPRLKEEDRFYQNVKAKVAAEKFISKFLAAGGEEAVDAVAWHHYYLHKNATPGDFLDPKTFDSLATILSIVKRSVHHSKKPLWMTECGSASGGGVPAVTDRFLSSFLFLDRLGLAAVHGVQIVVRQSLYSGHYSLIHLNTLTPNPDWWVSFIYKLLVLPKVLSIESVNVVPNTLRVYAHCSHNHTAVVFGMNLANAEQEIKIHSDESSQAELYMLTSPNIHSRQINLNGKTLRPPRGSRPLLTPVTVNIDQPLILSPYSMFFLRITNSLRDQC